MSWGSHLARKALQRPTATERSPCFEMSILQTPLVSCRGSIRSSASCWASSQPRANNIAQIRERLHHLRAIQALILILAIGSLGSNAGLLRPSVAVGRRRRMERAEQKAEVSGKLASDHGGLLFKN